MSCTSLGEKGNSAVKASMMDFSELVSPWATSMGGNAAKANSAERACAAAVG